MEGVMSSGSQECATCKNYMIDLHCRAFLDGIPEKIVTGEVSHKKPFKGDHGIQYEPREKE
jgi:hypothetical protein